MQLLGVQELCNYIWYLLVNEQNPEFQLQMKIPPILSSKKIKTKHSSLFFGKKTSRNIKCSPVLSIYLLTYILIFSPFSKSIIQFYINRFHFSISSKHFITTSVNCCSERFKLLKLIIKCSLATIRRDTTTRLCISFARFFLFEFYKWYVWWVLKTA